MRWCPTCGSEMQAGSTEHSRKVAGVTFAVELPAWLCGACDESLVDLGDLERFELRVAKWLADAGTRTPETFRFMRKALRLRAIDLGELLNVTPETISRWERGGLPVEHRALALLGGLVADKLAGRQETQARLLALRSPAEVPSTVRLDAA